MESIYSQSYRSSATTVLATVMVGLEESIRNQGGDAEQIFKTSGLTRELANKPNQPISLESYCAAIDEAAKQTGNSNFGLWFGKNYSVEAFGLVGYLCLSSATLRDALFNLVQYFPIHQMNSIITLQEKNHLWHLEYDINDVNIQCRRHDAELTIALFLNIMRHALGEEWSPKMVHFEHECPKFYQDHLHLLKSEVTFSQKSNAIIFSDDVLDQPMPHGNDILLNVMKNSLESIQATSFPAKPENSLLVKIKHTLKAQLPYYNVSLEHISQELNMTSWTLQRRLSDQGLNFKHILEQTRKEIATHYLSQAQMNISELAALLGYTEVSAFSRAFQRWYNTSPKKWKNTH